MHPFELISNQFNNELYYTTTTNNTATITWNYEEPVTTADNGWLNLQNAMLEFGTTVPRAADAFNDVFTKLRVKESLGELDNFEPATEDELRGFIEEALV